MQTHDITKLPQWAQEHIERLAHLAAYWEGKYQRQQAGDTEAWYDMGHGMDTKQPLPPGSTLICRVPDGEVRMHARKGMVEVFAFGTRAGEMVLRPLASNHFAIGFCPDREGE
jgi:hypothetical protein